jgi:hypothetical protein
MTAGGGAAVSRCQASGFSALTALRFFHDALTLPEVSVVGLARFTLKPIPHLFTHLSHHEQDYPPEDSEHKHPDGKHQDITPSSAQFDADWHVDRDRSLGGLTRFSLISCPTCS